MSLKIDNNALTSLPRLPYSLEKIEASFNQLETLPELPGSLKVLDVRGNCLSTLPELPSSLEEIHAYRNQISVLPELPVSLKVLYVSGNRLTMLPELPLSLENIAVSRNRITMLPALPSSLQVLSAGGNRLSILPELPSSLKEFPLASGHSTFSPDEFAHYYSEPAIHQDLIVMYRIRHTVFCGTLPDKTPAISSCGTVRRCRLSAATSLWSSCGRYHLLPDKAGNHAAPLCRSTPYPCRSVFSALAGPETRKMATRDHST